jgi:hypothetical protein
VFKFVNINKLTPEENSTIQSNPGFIYCGRVSGRRSERPQSITSLGNYYFPHEAQGAQREQALRRYHLMLVEVVQQGLANSFDAESSDLREMWADLLNILTLYKAGVEITLVSEVDAPNYCDSIRKAVEYLAKNPTVQLITA